MLQAAVRSSTSIYEEIFENNLQRPFSDDEPLLIDALVPERFYSFNSLRYTVRSVAMNFRDQYGLQVGDIAAVYAPNDIDYFVAVHGSIAAGCATLILPICSTVDELGATLKIACPRVLITHPSLINFAVSALDKYGIMIPVFLMGSAVNAETQTSPSTTIDVTQPLSDLFSHPDRASGPLPQVAPEDIAYFFTTSGSTGPRKLVTITHQAGIARLRTLNTRFANPTVSDRMVSINHFGHGMAGTHALQAAVMEGLVQYVVDTTDIDTIFSVVERHQITDMIISPWIVGFAARHPEQLKKYNLTSLRSILTGGQAIHVKTLQKAKNCLGVCNFAFVYGSTEGLLPLCPLDPGEIKEYVGKRYSEGDYIIRIVDENGKDVAPGEPGELWVKSPALASGYYKNESKTAEVFDSDGFYHTSDIFSEDSEGNFRFVGRTSDFIRTCFKTVAAKHIEDVCMSFPGVHECAVVGALSAVHAYEFPRAYIVLESPPDSEFSEAFLQYVNAHVPEECMRLEGGVQILPELPRTNTGKVDRQALRNLAQQRIDKQIESVHTRTVAV
ncbi:hypothetical protein BX666DRAFT_1938279 [Dichotomocladium elegans]|nr:hypothetical protein BX666DRAFT_1938279 [Dichotomocladium elegans]